MVQKYQKIPNFNILLNTKNQTQQTISYPGFRGSIKYAKPGNPKIGLNIDGSIPIKKFGIGKKLTAHLDKTPKNQGALCEILDFLLSEKEIETVSIPANTIIPQNYETWETPTYNKINQTRILIKKK